MGVERNYSETSNNDLYRPPAFRKEKEETNELISNETSNILKEEPTLLSSASATSITTTTSVSCNNSPIHRNKNVNNDNITTSAHQTSIYISQQQQQVDDQQKQQQKQHLQQMRRERRPDRAVYIPRARRSQTTPPNSATTIQPPSLQQQPALSIQPPVITTTKTNDASKSLNQLAITLDDTTTVSVNQKPPSKVDDVGKINSSGVSVNTCSSNISTTATTILKKKYKLNKENKEVREQRREQRLLKKLSSNVSQQHSIENHTSKNNENLNKYSINTITNDDEESLTHIVNSQLTHSSSLHTLANDENNLSKSKNNNINNLSEDLPCDSSKELKLSPNIINSSVLEQHLSVQSIVNRELQSYEEHQEDNTTILEKSEAQFANEPVLNQSVEINFGITTNITSVVSDVIAKNLIINNFKKNNTMPKQSHNTKSNNKLNSEVVNNARLPNLRIEDVASQQPSPKCDIEEQELQRASKEINRSNRRIIRQTFASDVLQIPDNINEEENEDQCKVADANKTPLTTTQLIDSNTEEEGEDDWENMYNDSGDCLDPKIMQELTASVGKCKIELPKMDYSAYLTKQSILNEEEFPHVLEVSNFPIEFKNQDLFMVFSQYKESGFDIKWVDDTHALAVFSSSRIAAEVLTMGHPFVVLKPLAEATIESRLKAKKCAASLQPYRPRPETCAALARRLVTGALGVRLKTAAAERENEKRVLREAKERKLLAAKQREEVWES